MFDGQIFIIANLMGKRYLLYGPSRKGHFSHSFIMALDNWKTITRHLAPMSRWETDRNPIFRAKKDTDILWSRSEFEKKKKKPNSIYLAIRAVDIVVSPSFGLFSLGHTFSPKKNFHIPKSEKLTRSTKPEPMAIWTRNLKLKATHLTLRTKDDAN